MMPMRARSVRDGWGKPVEFGYKAQIVDNADGVMRRLFVTEHTPCTDSARGGPSGLPAHRDCERAARQCRRCPFLGRCGNNAVISRTTHGVWGGTVLPGDKPAELEPIYARLLEQFEQRIPIELADTPVPQLPDVIARRRRRAAA